MAQALEPSWLGFADRKQKFDLVKEALSERSHFIDNAAYMNKYIPIIIPCENIIKTLYYYTGVIFSVDFIVSRCVQAV